MSACLDIETTMVPCSNNSNFYIDEYKIKEDDDQNNKIIKKNINESINYNPDEDSMTNFDSSKLMKRNRESVSDFEGFIEHVHFVNKVSKKLNTSRKDIITISKQCDKNDEHRMNEILSVFMNDMILPDEISSSNNNTLSCISSNMNINMNSLNDFLSITKAKNDLFWSDVFVMEQEAL